MGEPTESDDPDTTELAREVIKELDPGTVIDDKLILSRRQAIALATGTIGLGAIVGAGSQQASAQAAGQVGTSSEPVDVQGYDVTVQNTLQDGAGTQAFIEVIASGSVTLSSGSATVTVESASGTTYYLALGTDANAKVSGRVFDDGDVKVEIVETDTSVGNPTVEYDVLKVR